MALKGDEMYYVEVTLQQRSDNKWKIENYKIFLAPQNHSLLSPTSVDLDKFP